MVKRLTGGLLGIGLSILVAGACMAQSLQEVKSKLMTLSTGGDPAAVADHCRKVLAKDPLGPAGAECAYLLRIAYERAGREPKELLPEYVALSKKADGSAAIRQNLGMLHLKGGLEADAERDFARALELAPQHAEAAFSLALLRHSAGVEATDPAKLQEAEQLYKRALDSVPEFAEAACNLGLLYESQGKSKEAEAYRAKALKLRPDMSCGQAPLQLRGLPLVAGMVLTALESYAGTTVKDWMEEKVNSFSVVTDVAAGGEHSLKVPRVKTKSQYTIALSPSPTGPARILVKKYWSDPGRRYDTAGYTLLDADLNDSALTAPIEPGYKLVAKRTGPETAEVVVKKKFWFFYLPGGGKKKGA